MDELRDDMEPLTFGSAEVPTQPRKPRLELHRPWDRLVMTFPAHKWRHFAEKMAHAILRRGWTQFRYSDELFSGNPQMLDQCREFHDAASGVKGMVCVSGPPGPSRRYVICVEGRC